MRRSLMALGVSLVLGACASPKQPYLAEDEPDDLAPSARYELTRLTLDDELPNHSDLKEFYLCQGRRQVMQLQKDLPQYTFHHASLSYTRDFDGWPVALCHRHSDDAVVTRVEVEVLSLTPEAAVTRLYIGSQYPNVRVVTLTFKKWYHRWHIVSRDRPEPLRI